jgi:hypothetical protein
MGNLIWVQETFRAYLSHIIGIYRKIDKYLYLRTIVKFTIHLNQTHLILVIILAKVILSLYMFVKLRLDDPTRKRNNSGSSPKLKTQTPKKQDRRASPRITLRNRDIRKTMI